MDEVGHGVRHKYEECHGWAAGRRGMCAYLRCSTYYLRLTRAPLEEGVMLHTPTHGPEGDVMRGQLLPKWFKWPSWVSMVG